MKQKRRRKNSVIIDDGSGWQKSPRVVQRQSRGFEAEEVIIWQDDDNCFYNIM